MHFGDKGIYFYFELKKMKNLLAKCELTAVNDSKVVKQNHKTFCLINILYLNVLTLIYFPK